MPKTLVIIPTYNECENLSDIVGRTLAATGADVEILIADDASPDGTGAIADVLADAEERVHVLHRAAKLGLGPAYLAGFDWALERDYDVVVEMDADGSHHPDDLPRMIDALQDHQMVLGSRWVPGGRVERWPLRRQLLSRAGNRYVRWALGIDVHDATGGFRAFRVEALTSIRLDTVASQGYCFQVDVLRRVLDAGCSVREIPIVFSERERGRSKMSSRIVLEALTQVTLWGLHRWFLTSSTPATTDPATNGSSPLGA